MTQKRKTSKLSKRTYRKTRKVLEESEEELRKKHSLLRDMNLEDKLKYRRRKGLPKKQIEEIKNRKNTCKFEYKLLPWVEKKRIS
jgi:hypothetical protein